MPGYGRGVPAEEVYSKIIFSEGLRVITYRANLDVSRELALFVAGLLLAERHRRGTPAGAGR